MKRLLLVLILFISTSCELNYGEPVDTSKATCRFYLMETYNQLIKDAVTQEEKEQLREELELELLTCN